MATTTVKRGQSVFDKVIECTGSIDNLFEMALLNGIGITQFLEVGTVLQTTPVTNKPVVALWSGNNVPATLSNIIDIDNGTEFLIPGVFPLTL